MALDVPDCWQSLRLRAADGVRLHAVAAGPADAPLVILLHGFPEFWYGWRHQLEPLASAGLRVLAPDQRGYNLSDKPEGSAAYRLDRLADDVLGLADSLGRRNLCVIGHDWGGVVARHLAGRNPERIRRAAILNAPHPATLWRYAARHPRQLLKSWYVLYFQLPLLPELSLRAGRFWMLRRVLRRIAVPIRVIWGGLDALLEPGLADAGLALCDRGEIFRLPDATHWLQHEAVDAVNGMLRDFLP